MTTKKLSTALCALALVAPASATSQAPPPPPPPPPPGDPGCPPGYFKVSTVDFPRYRAKDKNDNGLVCLKEKKNGRGFKARDDDGTIG